MHWSFANIDWNATAAWFGAVIAALTFGENRWRQWRDREIEKGARLQIDTAGGGDDGLLLDVRYRPQGGHTRFKAILRTVSPPEARFSKPGWSKNDYGGAVIMMPTQEFDPNAKGVKALEVALDDEREEGVIGTVVGLGSPNRKARISIEIVDLATGRVVLRAARSVTA